MNILCRKNELGRLLTNMKRRFDTEFNFFPKTWMMPYDLKSFEAYVLQQKDDLEMLSLQTGKKYPDPVYIAKPENGCQGKGIYLLTEASELDCVNSSL